MAAYASLLSLMRVIHDLETHPSPPISLDKQLVDSITQHITFFEEFLHSYISPPPVAHDDEEEEVADPLEMRIAGAAHAAEDAIEYHIVDCIKQKKRYQKEAANDDEKYGPINRYCGVLQSVRIKEMDSIKNMALVDKLKKTKLSVLKNQAAMKNVTASFVVAPSETTLVGSDDVWLKIMGKLVGGQLDRRVISIVGMDGIGAAHSAKNAIEYHIGDSINQKKNNYNKANDDDDDENIKSTNRCCGVLQSVIKEMDSIKTHVALVDTQKTRKVPALVVAKTNVTAQSETLVGSDDVLLEIMAKLAGGQHDFQVIPIVGMGGIGKTFLAKTIYEKTLIKDRFDICAWATISQNYDTEQILCQLLSQATKTEKEFEQPSGKRVDELGLELHQYLYSRRFLIVMDDMWSIDAWDKLQCYFPNNGNGSRVLVTTRLSQLSSQLNNNDYSLCMRFLDEASSWDLFSKTVFGDKSSCCPLELKEIGEKIVDNCRGLPLSIAVVGGLLKTMDGTRASWESVRDNFNSVVNLNNDKHCLRLLKLSYNHLPIYLKPCFLYMGVFEEDDEINVTTLVQLWVSEGFLKPTNGEALETTARGFLQDLIDRNLILNGELGSLGSLKFCKMHDLVRDMCMKEGQKEGFYHFIGKRNPPSPAPQRRVVIPKDTSIKGDLRFMSHTRSIICEHVNVGLCQNMVLLRTLHAQNKLRTSDDESSLESLVLRYVNLRHLSIKARCTSSFLPSVSFLWNLHTLVVSYSFYDYKRATLADFWNMPQFRHIEFVDDCVCLLDPPNCDGRDGDAVVIMENLHTLKGIRNFKCSEDVVKRLPNIKRLKLEYNRRGNVDDDDDGDTADDDVYFVGNMKNLCGLESLVVTFLPVGPISPMKNITFPHSLQKLNLCLEFGFEWDDMLERVGLLPLLEKLKILGGRFRKGEWEIAQGQFPSLKYLQLFKCEGLENLKAASEEDSSILPRLEHLKLFRLYDLKKITFELGNIDTLKLIMIVECGEGVVKFVKEMFDEQVELQGGEDQLSFQVVVKVREEQRHLMSLACPSFHVNMVYYRV